MNKKIQTLIMTILLLGASATSFAEQLDPNELALQYRKALMTLVGHNFGPMAGMIKGQIPWDNGMFAAYANDLEKVSSLNIMRGFRDGSHKGETKAKPEIWKNKTDFEEKMQDMTKATLVLSKAAAAGDKAAIVKAFKVAGGTCKACHDDYKKK